MNLREFINYFRQCPLCRAWITLDADLPSPSTLEIANESLLLSVYESRNTESKLFKLQLDTNQVISDFPFVFRGLHNDLKRIFSGQLSDHLKIEARCYNCMSFRYWSNNMEFDPKTKTLSNIGIQGERIKLKEPSVEYLLSSLHHSRTSEVNINGTTYHIPFIPFSSLNFKNPHKIIAKIKSILLLS